VPEARVLALTLRFLMELDDLVVGRLLDRVGLASGAGFVALDVVSRNKNTIDRDYFTGFQQGYVTNDNFLFKKSVRTKTFPSV